MSLVFNAFEIVAITLSVLILTVVSLDGESNWFEGLQLIAVYVMLAIVFFFVPAPSGRASLAAGLETGNPSG